MPRRLALTAVAFAVSLLTGARAFAQEACFTRMDNGADLTGWRKSATNHHGPGDGWTVENGALVGRQTAGNKGGILMTDRSYKDVEAVWEVKVDWGCDSGFFFRTTAGDRAYQVTIDHLMGAGVGLIYGEGFAQELYYRPFTLSNGGNTATKDPAFTPLFDLTKWPMIWKPAEWNEMRARVEGNPPRTQVWIAGVQVADYTDPKLRAEIDASGPLAIQVHGGADRWTATGSVQFRNIRVRDLAVPCDAGADGSAATDASDGAVAADAASEHADDATGPGAAGAGGASGNGGAAGNGGGAGAGGQPVADASVPADAAAGTAGAGDGGCGCALSDAARPGGGALVGSLLALAATCCRTRRRPHPALSTLRVARANGRPGAGASPEQPFV